MRFTRVSQAKYIPIIDLRERDGAIKAGETEHKLIAVGNMVAQCPHGPWPSDDLLLFHLPLPLVLYLIVQHSCEIGA